MYTCIIIFLIIATIVALATIAYVIVDIILEKRKSVANSGEVSKKADTDSTAR